MPLLLPYTHTTRDDVTTQQMVEISRLPMPLICRALLLRDGCDAASRLYYARHEEI